MAKFIVPLEMNKTFEVYFSNKEDVEAFDIWEYEPFLTYLKPFNDNYGYSVSVSRQSGLFGKSQTHYYTVTIYEIK